jgi:hypothetical protein
MKIKSYPKYLTFSNRNNGPSVLNQAFPLPELITDKRYFPKNTLLYSNLNSIQFERKFEMAQFFNFLKVTVEVEHFLVIPAIANLNRLNFYIPNKAKEDLYKIATDEAFHAEQSLVYLNSLQQQFQINFKKEKLPPKYIQNLESQKLNKTYEDIKELLPIIFGIVTETRISIELGRFAKDTQLENSVREICLSHALDEAVHSSQFQALGEWLWQQMDDKTKQLVSAAFIDALFYRNMPDLDALNLCLSFASDLSIEDSKKIILQSYNLEVVISQMLEICKPTLKYLLKNKMVSQTQIDNRIAIEKELLKKNFFNA